MKEEFVRAYLHFCWSAGDDVRRRHDVVSVFSFSNALLPKPRRLGSDACAELISLATSMTVVSLLFPTHFCHNQL